MYIFIQKMNFKEQFGVVLLIILRPFNQTDQVRFAHDFKTLHYPFNL